MPLGAVLEQSLLIPREPLATPAGGSGGQDWGQEKRYWYLAGRGRPGMPHTTAPTKESLERPALEHRHGPPGTWSLRRATGLAPLTGEHRVTVASERPLEGLKP